MQEIHILVVFFNPYPSHALQFFSPRLVFFFYTKRTHKGLALQVHYMKKIISREFQWLLINLVLAIPLMYIFFYSINLVTEGVNFSENEKDFITQMYVLMYVLAFCASLLDWCYCESLLR